MKHMACLVGLGIFLCLALASDFLEESTNASITLKPEDCEERPPFTGTVKVTVTNNSPFNGPGWIVELFVSNQQIDMSGECTSFYAFQHTEQLFMLGSFPQSYESPQFTHDNKGDLWRVEIRAKIAGSEVWEKKETRVLFYDQTETTFNLLQLPSL